MDQPHNPRHSSKSANWQTPGWLAADCRTVLGGIDIDPASCAKANKTICAASYLTKRENGLARTTRWRGLVRPSSIFLNPPGGWHNGVVGDSEIRHWWAKTLIERQQSYFGHMLWLAFSIEQLQVTQIDFPFSLLDFPTCILKRRVSFIDAVAGKPVSGNTHSSSVTYIPGKVNRIGAFAETFKLHGKIMLPWNMGKP